MLFKKIKITFPALIVIAAYFLLELSAYSLLSFYAAAIHEIAHLLTMKMLGKSAESIEVHPFGLAINCCGRARSYMEDALVYLSGPALNLLIFFAFVCSRTLYCKYFAYCNLFYAIINLLPIEFLDGGNALGCFLYKFFDYTIARKLLRSLSFVFLLCLWSFCIYLLLFEQSSLSLFLICVYFFIKLFLNE